MPPKQRVTPGLGISPTPGRPSAQPKDSFVQFTGNAAGGSLRELASSLSRFGEKGSRFAAEQQRKQQERQAAAGRTAFLKALEEQGDTAKAIASLELRPQQSAFFRFGVQSAAGKVDAQRARDFLYATRGDEINEALTLEEFDAIAEVSLNEYLEDRDAASEAFENGFFPTYMAMLENARFDFASSLDGKLSGQRLESFELSTLAEGKVFLEGGGDFAELGLEWTRQLDEIHDGENPLIYTPAQEILVQNLKSLADSTDDITVIEIAKSIEIGPVQPNGKRATLWDRYKSGPDGLEAGIDAIIRRESARRNNEIGRERRADDIATRTLQNGIMDIIIDGEGPRSIAVDLQLGKLALLAPAKATALRNFIERREGFADNTVSDVYDFIQSAIYRGEGSVGMILGNTDSLSRADTRNLKSALDAYEGSLTRGSVAGSLLVDPRIKPFFTELKGRYGSEDMDLSPQTGNRRAAASSQLRGEIILNAETLKGMSDNDLNAWMISHANRAFEANTTPDDIGIGGTISGDVPGPPGIRMDASQEELQREFRFDSDAIVSRVLTEWAGNGLAGSTLDPAWKSFRRRWNAFMPSALIPINPSAEEMQRFDAAYKAFKLQR